MACILQNSYQKYRSSHQRCSMMKVFLKILKNSAKKACVSLFLNKVAGLRVNVYKLFLNVNLSNPECFNKDPHLIHKTNLNLVNIDEITGNYFDNMADFSTDNSIASNLLNTKG